MPNTRLKNISRLLVYFLCIYLFSVSIGVNAVGIPTYVENSGFNTFSSTIILSAESIIAIFLCLITQQIIFRFGLVKTILVACLMRAVATLLLGYFQDPISWFALSLLVGGGSILYLLLIQICIHNIKEIKYKGIIYSIFGTLISLGIASGPLVYSEMNRLIDLFQLTDFVSTYFKNEMGLCFVISALITVFTAIPFFFGKRLVPTIQPVAVQSLFSIVKKNKGILFAVSLCGISFFSVSWYITIYGIRNNMSLFDASLLLSAFMVGSVVLDIIISFLSEHTDRRSVLVYSSLICTILAIFLPLAIYNKYHAFGLLFLWGGLISGMYTNCLFLLEKKYSDKDSTATNAAFSMMENVGATFGLLLIGTSINFVGTDAFSYIIIFSNLLYFSFVLFLYQSRL